MGNQRSRSRYAAHIRVGPITCLFIPTSSLGTLSGMIWTSAKALGALSPQHRCSITTLLRIIWLLYPRAIWLRPSIMYAACSGSIVRRDVKRLAKNTKGDLYPRVANTGEFLLGAPHGNIQVSHMCIENTKLGSRQRLGSRLFITNKYSSS
jgi:hypothetical protein